MLLKNMFNKVDKAICSYLGLNEEETHPVNVQLVKNTLIVENVSSHKRHLAKDSWEQFSALGIKQTNVKEIEKLGLAIGQAIAENLVVSFEDSTIQGH